MKFKFIAATIVLMMAALWILSWFLNQQRAEKFVVNITTIDKPADVSVSSIRLTKEISYVEIGGDGQNEFCDSIISINEMGLGGGNTYSIIKKRFFEQEQVVQQGEYKFYYGSNSYAIIAIVRTDKKFYLIRYNL